MPDANGFVGTAAYHQLAIGANGDRIHRIGVIRPGVVHFSSRHVPKFDGGVAAAANDGFTVGGDGNGTHIPNVIG